MIGELLSGLLLNRGLIFFSTILFWDFDNWLLNGGWLHHQGSTVHCTVC